MSDNPYNPPGAAVADAHQEAEDRVSLAELQAFTGKSSYPAKLKVFLDGEARLAGFNWWAAIFGTNWFVFRKLYLAAAIAVAMELGAPVLAGFVLGAAGALDLSRAGMAGLVAFVLARIFLGGYANVALAWKAARTIRETDALNLDNAAHLATIQKAGGVSVVAVILLYVALGFVRGISGTI